ncbi:plasmid mobilization relaxosome protein MobC [Lactococcus garvieae]|uniref:plasmid mobilization relaxosome protein MobC n=1 Tax=Lactococcus garvieae TaxID=1363 RepID=UPI00254DC8B4|nr:plasmid mobilization relaxosome protein MobC [Lactococcus garvieae]
MGQEQQEMYRVLIRDTPQTIRQSLYLLMALDGEIRTYDFSSVKEGLLPIGEYSVALNRIGNNINQISKKANETDVIDNEDIQYLSSQVHDMKQNYEAVIKKLTQEITRLRTK